MFLFPLLDGIHHETWAIFNCLSREFNTSIANVLCLFVWFSFPLFFSFTSFYYLFFFNFILYFDLKKRKTFGLDFGSYD